MSVIQDPIVLIDLLPSS